MSIDIDKLEAIASAATPGERHIEQDRNDQWNVYADAGSGREWLAIIPHQCVASIEEERARDAAFFEAATPNVVIELIQRVRAAERIVAAALEWYPSVRTKAQHARMPLKELRLWRAARDLAEERKDAPSPWRTDRPPHGVRCLVTVADSVYGSRVEVASYVEGDDRWVTSDWRPDSARGVLSGVVAWMPCPEPATP